DPSKRREIINRAIKVSEHNEFLRVPAFQVLDIAGRRLLDSFRCSLNRRKKIAFERRIIAHENLGRFWKALRRKSFRSLGVGQDGGQIPHLSCVANPILDKPPMESLLELDIADEALSHVPLLHQLLEERKFSNIPGRRVNRQKFRRGTICTQQLINLRLA